MPTPQEIEYADKSIYGFLEVHHISNDQGERLDFYDHPYLWDIYGDWSQELVCIKAAQIGFCLLPSTKVLTTDYRWVALDDLKIGQELVSVDEFRSGGQGRKTRIGIVEAKNEVYEESYALTLENGTVLTATAKHRFLSKKRGSVDTMWREVSDFRIGDEMRYFCEVWKDGVFEDAWMGGILDGEGSMRRHGSSCLCIVQTKGAVLDRIRKYFVDRSYIHRYADRSLTKKGVGTKPIFEVSTSNTAEIFKIVGQTRPTRFTARTDWWIDKCLGRDKNKQSWYKVVKIEAKGKQRMVDIQTSTKTFIAEGFVSHNSTTANIKALWLAKNWRQDGKGFDIIYSLPSASDMNLFVSSKTNRLIANNEEFQKWTDDKDSIEQKRIGKSTIHFRGTQTEQAALAIPADLYIADEVDRSKQDVVRQFSTRLQHSDYKWRWYFSNPSTPGYGVDVMWEKSDQKHYFYQCDCGHWQYLTMDNIMGDKPYFGCMKCKKELSRKDNHGKSKWVAKYQGRKISGYWISLLMNPKVSAQEILDKKKEYTDAQFANYVLGQPYLSKGAKLISTQFLQNLTDRTNPMDSRVIIGVDTGNAINFVAGNRSGLFYYGKSNGYTEVRNLMKRYPNAIMLIDNGGDITGPKQLKEDFPNRVYTCFLRNDRKNDELWKFNDDDMSVAIDRNKCLQLCVDELAERRVPIYGSKDDWWDFWIEWDRMRRVEEVDDKGDKKYQWEKTPGQRSDWPFAHVFWRVGMGYFMDEKVTFCDPNTDDFAFRGMEVDDNNLTRFNPRIIF